MIRAEKIAFSYKKKGPCVLENVSFEARKGEITAFIGPNGSGKTTLFRLLLGLVRPQEGKILLDGNDLLRLSPRAKAKLVAHVPQALSFNGLTVLETVLLGRTPYFEFAPRKEDYEIAFRVLGELGISHLSNRLLEELSGGERQKVAVARALAQRPKALIFDEPTSNLDIAGESMVMDLAKKASKDMGMAVLVAVHDLSLALNTADRIFVFDHGCLLGPYGPEAITNEVISQAFSCPLSIIKWQEQYVVICEGREK